MAVWMQGRFSGRLETKEDEKKVAEECKLLGPLVGGSGKRGERSRLTLAKIVRGIASGHVREFLEAREVENQVSILGASMLHMQCHLWLCILGPKGPLSDTRWTCYKTFVQPI